MELHLKAPVWLIFDVTDSYGASFEGTSLFPEPTELAAALQFGRGMEKGIEGSIYGKR